MKNILMVLGFVTLFFGCEMNTNRDNNQDSTEDGTPTTGWNYYVNQQYTYAYAYNDDNTTSFQEPIIELTEEGFNIVGAKRGPVSDVKNYQSININFSDYVEHPDPVYYGIEDGADVEPGTFSDPGFNGTTNNNITYQDASVYIYVNNIVSDSSAVGANANLQIGDELAKITFYADANHNAPIETFSLIL